MTPSSISQLTTLETVIVGLATITGAIHLLLGLLFLPDLLAVSFVLAAGGYLVGILFILTERQRRLVYLLGVPFVAAQIIGWYVVNQPQTLGDIGPLEAIDKVVQAILIILLVVGIRRES